jgi:hypothetical protein
MNTEELGGLKEDKGKSEFAKDDLSSEDEPTVAKLSENGDVGKKNGSASVESHSSADELDNKDKSEAEDEGDEGSLKEEAKEAKAEPKAKDETEPEPPGRKRGRGPKAKLTSAAAGTDFDSSLVGALDTSLAEQVKSDGLRRERKQVQHFSVETTPREHKAIVIVSGSGTKLNEIPFIADQIQVCTIR